MTAIGPLANDRISEVVALWRACGLVRPWNDPDADARLALASPSSTILADYIDGVLAATVMAGFDGHRGWAYYLAVDPARRGQGLARSMMTAAEDWLRERGAPRLNLMVRADNAAVRDFYAALGYRTSDVTVLQLDL